MHKLEEILLHYGVKGMKWDEKKAQEDSLSLEAIAAKYNLSPEQAANVKALAESIKKNPNQQPSKKPASTEAEKLADEVMKGLHGNGEERRKKLGAKYAEVQDLVNEKLGVASKTKKSTSTNKKSTSAKKKSTPAKTKSKKAKTVAKVKAKLKPKKAKATVSQKNKSLKSAKAVFKPKKKSKKKSYVARIKATLKREKKSISKSTKQLKNAIANIFK